MTIVQIKQELKDKGISHKGITKKQELLNLIPTYRTARERQGYLTERGIYWLKINIANLYGYDKLTFDDRITKANEILDNPSLFLEQEAESPIEFRNALEDYQTHLRGEAVESIMYLDCSNQALQLYAVLTSDKKTAELCNLANGNDIADAYKIVADTMNRESDLTIFNRDNCKKAVMTTLYSKANVGETIKEADLAITEEAEEINELFQHSFNIVAPEAKEAMEALLSLNNEDKGVYYWSMPDNFQVKYDVKSKHDIHIQGQSKEGIHLEFNQTVKRYAPSEHNRGMSPNIIHSFDGYIVREIERQFNHFFTSIHDAFGVHYNYIDELREIYINILCDINTKDYLKPIMEQVSLTQHNTLKKNTLSNEDIRTSVYYLS